ncbi:MAG: hypothetical protein LDLANPLL_01877 [Turneriella sp.]|nr:hypothetical protein [Turneriella sp.]
MQMRCRIVFLFISAIFFTQTLAAKVNFTGLAGADLDEANALDAKYTNLAAAISKYYGEGMAFASHLSAPNARDNLGAFPSFYVGVGMGTTFSRVYAVKDSVDSTVKDTVPGVLPAPNISINFGFGITRSWDIRFSFFPNVPISFNDADLPVIKFGTYRARVGYHVWEGGFLKPGFTIAGFVSYTTGSVSFKQDGQSVSGNASLANMSSTLSSNWQYLGVGPEARFWYDLKFFNPFIGYSLGLQIGQMTTGLDVKGDLTVGATPYGTGTIEISERKAARIVTHRILFGFEVSLFVFDIGVEAQVDLTSGLMGFAAGTAFRF